MGHIASDTKQRSLPAAGDWHGVSGQMWPFSPACVYGTWNSQPESISVHCSNGLWFPECLLRESLCPQEAQPTPQISLPRDVLADRPPSVAECVSQILTLLETLLPIPQSLCFIEVRTRGAALKRRFESSCLPPCSLHRLYGHRRPPEA